MGLKIQRRLTSKSKALTILIAVFALVAQPFYGLVSDQVASAAPITDRVVINEVDPFTDKVELFNGTSSDVTIANWSLTEHTPAGNPNTVTSFSGVIESGKYLVVTMTNINDTGGDYIKLVRSDASEDKVVFGVVAGQASDSAQPVNPNSVQRNGDSETTWRTAAPTIGSANINTSAPTVCTYDFQSQKMWEITWGYGFEDRNGGAAKFTKQSNGGLVSLNGNPVPSYMSDASWRWLYVTDNGNYNPRHYDYGFADGTVRTVDIAFSEVNGCQIPEIVWGFGESTLDAFPSTNANNKANNHHYVEQVSATNSSVTLRFVNPTNYSQYFEYRKDNAASVSTAKHNPCRIGVTPLNNSCAGKRYLAADDLSYSSQFVSANSSVEKTYDAVDNVAIRVTFGPERSWDFDWTTFASEADPNNSNALNLSGNVYRDVTLNDCDNKTECENRTNEMLADWEMRLYKEDDAGVWQNIRTSVTNNSGVYNFGAQQLAGVYHVCEVLKTGWTQPIQNWSGSGYQINTPNASSVAGEGPYCTTTNYTDVKDNSSVSRFGNVDTGKPVGTATYIGGKDVNGVRYIKNIDAFTFTATIDDNHSVDRASYTVTKLNNSGVFVGFCGNWNSNSTSSYSLDGDSHEEYTAGIENCAANTNAWTDGTYRIGHAAYDTAGNEGKFNADRQVFVIDSTAPARVQGIKILQNGKEVRYTSERTIKVDWNDSQEADFSHYEYQNREETTVRNNLKNSEFTGDIRNEDGDYKFRVRAIDTAGNAGAWSSWAEVALDRQLPSSTDDLAALVTGNVTITQAIADNVAADSGKLRIWKLDESGNQTNEFYGSAEKTVDNANQVTYVLDTVKNLHGNGQYVAKFTSWDKARNASVQETRFTVNNINSVVLGENFNTVDDNYKGISVGFSAQDFADVTSAIVELTREDGSTVTKTAGEGVLSLIRNNRNKTPLTAPFVITSGIFTEAGDKDSNENFYWLPAAPAVWNANTRPVSVKVTITDQNGSKEVTMSAEQFTDQAPSHSTYVSLLPVVGVNPVDPEPATSDGELPLVLSNLISTPTPLPSTVAALFNNTFVGNRTVPAATNDEAAVQNAAVLGTQDKKAETPLANTGAIAPSSEGWKIFGMAWFWWLAILAAAIAGWLWLAAAIRRRRGYES